MTHIHISLNILMIIPVKKQSTLWQKCLEMTLLCQKSMKKQEPAVVYSQSGIIMEIQPQSVVKTGSTSSILLLLQDIVLDHWLRFENNGLSSDEMGEAQRINYAGKLANFTVINSGQIDADPENIGTVSWTYQSEMGNDTALGTGGGKLHNGWRQMSGEADLALFGAVRIASSDVAIDPVFGLFGYGCEVTDNGASYSVVPLDGVYHRLNLINNKISLELYRDQYDSATVSKDGSTISMNIVNVTRCERS